MSEVTKKSDTTSSQMRLLGGDTSYVDMNLGAVLVVVPVIWLQWLLPPEGVGHGRPVHL